MRKYIDIINGNASTFDFDPLLEANRAYEEMMDACLRFIDNVPFEIDRGDYRMVAERIKATAKWLGNGRNAATWFVRIERAMLLNDLRRHIESSGQANIEANAMNWKKVTSYIDKITSEYTRQTGKQVPHATLGEIDRGVQNFKEQMEHFRTVDYGPIQNYHFENQNLGDVLTALSELEALHNERNTTNLSRRMTPLEGDKIALKCKDGFAWWLLPRNSCTREKEAMGHCGNTASPKQGQRILSLRQYLGKDAMGNEEWAPYLTFIWNADGTLGERKGRNNHKPAPVFYPYIAQLFKQHWITGLGTGAHWSHNDIALKDLPEAMQADILAANPKIEDIKDRINRTGMTSELADEIAEGVKKLGEYYYHVHGITLDQISPDDKKMLFDLHPELMGEADYYERYGLDDKLMDIIHNGFERDGRRYVERLKFLSKEDLAKIFEKHPQHMSERDRYEIHGMDDFLMQTIATKAREMCSGSKAITSLGLSMVITDEDREKLYHQYPETQPFSVWYAQNGMSEAVMAYIKQGIDRLGPSFWYAQDIQFRDISQEDRFKLWDRYPSLMSLDDRYERFGLTDELEHIVAQNILNNIHEDDCRRFISKLRNEDAEKLFTDYPFTMRPREYYPRLGMTDEFKQIVLNGLKKDGVRWFNDHYVWPAWNIRGAIRPMWMDRLGMTPDAITFSDEDTLKLFDGHDDLLLTTLPMVYYKLKGMDAKLRNYLKTHADTHGWGHALGTAGSAVPIQHIDKRHQNLLFKHHPDLMLPKHYYERFGLTKEFMKWLGTKDWQFRDGSRWNQSEDNTHQPTGMNWKQHPTNFDFRKEMKKADIEKLFKAYPDLMTWQEHYQRLGLDKHMMKMFKDGFKVKGKGYWEDIDFNPEEELKGKDLAALYRANPQMMSFARQVEVLPARTVVKNMIAFKDQLYDSSALGDFKWDSKDKVFVINEYSTISDFLEDWGDDTIKHYAGEDPFDHWHGEDGDADRMDSVLPVSVMLSIGKYALAEYGSGSGSSSDEDDDDVEMMDDEEDFDWTDWDEVKEKLKEEDDSVIDALQYAANEGERYGAEADASDEVNKAVRYASSELTTGHFDMPLVKGDNGKEYVPHDGKIRFCMTLKDVAGLFDGEVDGRDNELRFESPQDFLRSKISVNSDNFYGFDEEAALERFYEECPDEALEHRQKNPFRELVEVKRKTHRGQEYTAHEWRWKRMSAKKMRAALEAIFATSLGSKKLRWYKRDFEEKEQDDASIKKMFENVMATFYGMY